MVGQSIPFNAYNRINLLTKKPGKITDKERADAMDVVPSF